MTRWQRRCFVKRVKHAIEAPFAWFGIGLGLLIMTFLPHCALLVVCDLLSCVFYHVDRRGRCRALENLHILRGVCVGDEGTPQFNPRYALYKPTQHEELIIRRSYRTMARTVGHIFWTMRKAVKRVGAIGEMGDAAHAFLRAHRPAITVSAHLGCWEILSQLAFLEGHAMMSVAKRIGTHGMTYLLMKARKSIGQEIVTADGALRALKEGLAHGKSLGLLVDQPVDSDLGGVWIRFLGRPMPVSVAPAFFAAKAKADIIVAWSRPLKNGHYRCETIQTYSAEDARDIWGMTQTIARDLERIIRRHPSCWVLNYNYFNNQPTPEQLAKLQSHLKTFQSGLS